VKYFIASLCVFFFFVSCKNDKTKIVDKVFVDSLITHYTFPAAVKANEDEMKFWKNRIDPSSTGIINESKYAATLISRFHQFGDIKDVKQADSIMQKVNAAFNYKEASPNIALTGYSILQHRFKEADAYLEKARLIGLKRYESLTASFDVDFELGRYNNAALYVKQLQPEADYGYYFRRSKLNHLNGNIDSAIQAMLKASELAESSIYLQGVALSNAADLYIHAGELQKAKDLYVQCIKMNSADFHSITGLGWIALVQDKNDSLAEQIFQFVHTKNKLPDPLFKLYQMAQQREDSILETEYANEFAAQATDTVYGNMYNKYLIEIYTGILHNPAKAEAISKNELSNRSTAQTNAWYAWSLFANNKKEEAYKIYEQSVSGKPLEGLELYWMGKLMQGLGKGYNAKEFFKAADKNYYDLSPAMQTDLKKNLE
jgi:Tetratricopeptide repeat